MAEQEPSPPHPAGAKALRRGNLFSPLPPAGLEEHFELLFAGGACRVERIVSHGQASPPGFWYEQAEDEWVVLLQGCAELGFANGARLTLKPGESAFIGCNESPVQVSGRGRVARVFNKLQ